MSLPSVRRSVSVYIPNHASPIGIIDLWAAVELVREGHADWYKNRHIRMLRTGYPIRGASCYGIGWTPFSDLTWLAQVMMVSMRRQ